MKRFSSCPIAVQNPHMPAQRKHPFNPKSLAVDPEYPEYLEDPEYLQTLSPKPPCIPSIISLPGGQEHGGSQRPSVRRVPETVEEDHG